MLSETHAEPVLCMERVLSLAHDGLNADVRVGAGAGRRLIYATDRCDQIEDPGTISNRGRYHEEWGRPHALKAWIRGRAMRCSRWRRPTVMAHSCRG